MIESPTANEFRYYHDYAALHRAISPILKEDGVKDRFDGLIMAHSILRDNFDKISSNRGKHEGRPRFRERPKFIW